MWDLTTRVHKIFVLFVEFHVVSQSSRNKDVKKLKGKKTNKHSILLKGKHTWICLGKTSCAWFQLFERTGYFMYLINRFALQCSNGWECEQKVHNQHVWPSQKAYNAVCSIVFNLWCIFIGICPEELHHHSSCFFTVNKTRAQAF